MSDQLLRRAYGPPLSEADAAQAQHELRLLAERGRMPDPLPPASAPAVASVPLRGKLLLAAACLGVAALATGTVLAPAPSLAVFAAEQPGVPQWPGAPAGDDDIRWLGTLGPWEVFGLITTGGNVCVTAFANGASGGGSCTSQQSFGRQGLVLHTGTLQVRWGPVGGAQLDDSRR